MLKHIYFFVDERGNCPVEQAFKELSEGFCGTPSCDQKENR